MRRTVSFLAAAVLFAATWPATASASRLSDMQAHWARAQVESGVGAGYVAGYPDGTFRPNNPITRAEFYKLLGAALRLEPARFATGFAEEQQAPLHWSFAQGHIPAAVGSGLLAPSDYESRLAPDTRITRREIVISAVRALGKEPLVAKNRQALTAPDWHKYPTWLQPYAALAVGSGIVTGYEDGSLGLDRNATRAEALVMVQRILGQVTVGLTEEAGPGIPNGVRHPGEGEPTWTWREAGGRLVISNGTEAQDITLVDGATGLTLRPAPGKAVWVKYSAGGEGVVARLNRGKLTEVARYPGRTPDLLAVDDEGRLWYSDAEKALLVAGADGRVTPVDGLSDRITAGSIDWNEIFWGVSGSKIWRVSADLEAIPYPLEMRPDQRVESSALADDGSVWLLLQGDANSGAKVEAVRMEYGRVTHRFPLLGRFFGGPGTRGRVQMIGRSGPFLWLQARVIAADFTEKSAGFYRLNLSGGDAPRLVLPAEAQGVLTAVQAADGGALLKDGAGRFWRMLP